MSKDTGYYRGILEHDGLKTTFIVFALSDKQAASKALNKLEGAKVSELEGPYLYMHTN